MSDDRRDGRLPAVLREPPSTNAPRLVHSRVPARLAPNHGGGRPRVAPLRFRWIGRALEMSTIVGSRQLDDMHDGDPVAVPKPARDRCEQLRDGERVLLTVEPVEASTSQMWDARHRREPTSAR